MEHYHEHGNSYEHLLRMGLGYQGKVDRKVIDLDAAQRHVSGVIKRRPENIAEVADSLALSLGLESSEMRRLVGSGPSALDEVCYVVKALLPYLKKAC